MKAMDLVNTIAMAGITALITNGKTIRIPLHIIQTMDNMQGDFSDLLFDIQLKMEYPYPWASTVQVLYYAAFIIFQ